MLLSLIKLSDEERLEILRRLDPFHEWRSLDEKRYCMVCGKIITGSQIQVAEDEPFDLGVQPSAAVHFQSIGSFLPTIS